MSTKYPFEGLDVGGAFDVPLTPTAAYNLRMYAQRYGARLGRKFSVRVFADEGVVEVSRVEPPATEAPVIRSARPATATGKRDYAAEIAEVQRKIDAGEL